MADAAQTLFGKPVTLVDSGSAAADALKAHLQSAKLLKDSTETGKTSYFVSDRPYDFAKTASLFLGEAAENVTQIDIERYLYTRS